MCRGYHSQQLERQWSFIYMHSINFRKRANSQWDRYQHQLDRFKSIYIYSTLYKYKLSHMHTRKISYKKKFQHFTDRSNVLDNVLPTFLLETWDVSFTLHFVAVQKLTVIILVRWKNSTCFSTKRASIITEPCIFKNVLRRNIPVLFIILVFFKNTIHDAVHVQCRWRKIPIYFVSWRNSLTQNLKISGRNS